MGWPKQTNIRPPWVHKANDRQDEVEKFVEDVDSLLSCLIHRHRGTMEKIGEYEEIARLAAEARRVAQNPGGLRTAHPEA